MTALEKLQKAKQEFEALQQELQEKGKNLFKEACSEIFELYPFVESFAWKQYSPHFNDGDECVFSVHNDADQIEINDISSDDDWDSEDYVDEVNVHKGSLPYIYGKIKTQEDFDFNQRIAAATGSKWLASKQIGEEGKIPNPDYVPEYEKCVNDVCGLLQSMDDNTMQNMFGNHVKITITKSTVDISHYRHD